ncbi:double zinc ribbon and ankyrin repeat-containing protein 1 isoform X2 [Rhineura floridana]|uniref:double zinc ribbon and ankyrin repeat-containing protein 1 isoform X2 n=1 Tax=Rhineura floridana TaxID=261503 RepID=UPI002AC875D7|nr:double zinc ribbon and ankyrin repeat-containing protein 1 isoform X2 [Rhineura floridana]
MTAGSILVPQVIPLRISTPGKAKHEIDTNTLIEIKSDTPDVTIYYTIDGSKPQLFRRLGYRDHNTYKYKGPITLPDGKIAIKALAVTKDGRESTIVTKVFIVEYVTPNTHEDNDENFLEDPFSQEMEDELCDFRLGKKEANAESKFNYNGVALELQGMSKEKTTVPSHLIGPHLLNNYLNMSNDREESNSATLMPQSQFASSVVDNRRHLTSIEALRTRKKTDFLKCAQCLAPHTSGPFSRFCQNCGSLVPSVPKHSILLTAQAQMGLCIKCQTMVPMNSPTCVVCDAPMAIQLQPKANTHQKDNVLCYVCGVGNPICLAHCVVCESQLPEAQRNNSLQTWEQSAIPLPTSRPNLLEKKEQGTQTIGLFYPSMKFLKKKECELVSQKEKLNETNDHKPLLTAISPGRGYWRKQLDHVCAHLRSYTQNNLEFRTLIGEPQMGKLISATVHKDSCQVSLQINYALPVNKDILTNKSMTFGYHELSSSKAGKAGLYDSQASLESKESQGMLSPSRKIKRQMKTRKCLEKEDKLTTESRQLLKEVGPKGQGQPFLVEQLIDEGADPNCTNNDDRSALTLAVLNKHHEVVPVLVQKGADVDHHSGLLNNTALHEALLLGLEGWECMNALLGKKLTMGRFQRLHQQQP